MRIVFWQNCLSPHQLPYIVHLMDDKRVDEVVVVTEESISDERKKMGWELGCYPQIEKCSIIISPNNDKIRALFNMREADSWHLFSGIHGFPFIFHCFKISLVYNIKRGIVTECPYTYAFGSNNGKPLWLHSIRFFLQDYKYAKYIDKVFAMGNRATKYFKSVYSKWNVYPFMYCTQPKEKNNLITNQTATTKFLFVGSLSYRKSPKIISSSLVSCIKNNSKFDCHVTYVGDGNRRIDLENYIIKNNLKSYVTLTGFQPQTEIPTWMSKNDILILPSIHDGWGAVVNEALQTGMYVICSNTCGAADLLKDERIGKVFHVNNEQQLSEIMQWCHDNIDTIRRDRFFRQQWADKHISGRVLAKYMINCLSENK